MAYWHMQDQQAELQRFKSSSNPSSGMKDAAGPASNGKLAGQVPALSFDQRQEIIRTTAALRRTSAAGTFKASGQVPSEAHHLPPGAWQEIELQLQRSGLLDDSAKKSQVLSSDLGHACNQNVQQQMQQQQRHLRAQTQPSHAVQDQQQPNTQQPDAAHPRSMGNFSQPSHQDHSQQPPGHQQGHSESAQPDTGPLQLHQQRDEGVNGSQERDEELNGFQDGGGAAGLKGDAAEELRGLARLEENALEAKVLAPICKHKL